MPELRSTQPVTFVRRQRDRILASERNRALLERAAGWLAALPAWVAVLYGVLLLVVFKATVEAVYANADIASGPMIGETYDGGVLTLGFLNWFEGLWLEQITKWMPLHRYLWQYGPWVLTMLGLAAVAWTAARATGRRWAGITFFAVPFCATAALMPWQFAISGHALAWLTVLLVGAFLVAAAWSGGWLAGSLPLHIVVTLFLAGAAAVGWASDKAVEAAVVVPCAIAGVIALRALRWPAGWRVGSSALVIAASAWIFHSPIADAAARSGIAGSPFDVIMADPARRAANLQLFWKSAPMLLGGDYTSTHGVRHGLALLCAWILAACVIAGLVYAAVVVLRALWRPASANPARVMFVLFWGLSLGAIVGAFIWTTAPQDLNSNRYLISAAYALVGLVVIAAADRRWSRAVAGLGLGIIAFAGFVSLANQDLRQDPAAPNRQMADAVTRVGHQWGVKKGYAGYWDAAPLTWMTRNEFHIYPVDNCQANTVCPFNLHIASSWYKPVKGIKTMLLVDPAIGLPKAFLQSSDPRLGKPLAVENTGRLIIYVYPYDISAGFGPK